MTTRRQVLKGAVGAAAGVVFVGCPWTKAVAAAAPPGGAVRRREVVVSGRRVKTVDVHCHCYVPEALDVVRDFQFAAPMSNQLAGRLGPMLNVTGVQERVRWMDEQGLDVQALSINPYWYSAERDVAAELIKLQNEKLAEFCATQPDRFVGLATAALQYPYLAAEQLEDAVSRLGLRGVCVGGSVEGEELADRRFNPFWAKAEELGCLIFIHPQDAGVASEIPGRLQGSGALVNTIGNPLETTIALSHLIFEGTLDRYPGLKICAAHGGGYLPSYISRSDQCFSRTPAACPPLQKLPSGYLGQLFFDSMVFTSEGLRHLAAEAGAGQIVLGTDYPYGWTDESVDHILSAPDFTDADKRAMLGETAAGLLNIALAP